MSNNEHITSDVVKANERFFNNDYLTIKDGRLLSQQEREWGRSRDAVLVRQNFEAYQRNKKRSLKEKILGRNTLSALDIAHEEALTDNSMVDYLKKIKQK